MCLMFQFPLLWMVMTSFKHQRDIFTSPPTIWFEPTLRAYTHVLASTDLSLHMLNTLIVALGSARSAAADRKEDAAELPPLVSLKRP